MNTTKLLDSGYFAQQVASLLDTILHVKQFHCVYKVNHRFVFPDVPFAQQVPFVKQTDHIAVRRLLSKFAQQIC